MPIITPKPNTYEESEIRQRHASMSANTPLAMENLMRHYQKFFSVLFALFTSFPAFASGDGEGAA